MRTIAHVDADAFYVSAELLRRPELRGRPVVVAGSGPRAVVTTASYEARRYGVMSAIPAARARSLCPEAVFLTPDFGHYREMSSRLMAIVRSYAERVEVAGLDEAYLDLSGYLAPHAAMRRMAAQVHEETGLTCSVGIGPNKLVAKIASDAEKPEGMVVLTRAQACERFAGAPPRLLPGIGPKTGDRLEGMGLRTLSAVREAPEQTLVSHFGPRMGAWLARSARFEHDGAVSEERAVVSQSAETTFDRDLSQRAEMGEALRALATRLCERLAGRELAGRTVGIKVRLDDFTTVTRARTLEAPTRDPGTVGRTALDLLAAYGPPRPVRLLGVRLAGLEEAGREAPPDPGDQLSLPEAIPS